MPIEFSAFDPSSATDADFAEHYEVTTATMLLDHPEQPNPTLEEFTELLREPKTAMGPIRRWVAREDGRIIATASAIFPECESLHMVVVRIVVTPEKRRRGIGTALLRAVLPELTAAEGRTVVAGNGVKGDASGESWARALGFVRTQAYLRQMLRPAAVDPGLWQRPVPEGFRLERWAGAAPEP